MHSSHYYSKSHNLVHVQSVRLWHKLCRLYSYGGINVLLPIASYYMLGALPPYYAQNYA